MKTYSNSIRKPMMYGGESRMKRQYGSDDTGEKKAKASAAANADVQSRLATGRATAKDKELQQKQVLEQMMRKKVPELQKIAANSDRSAMERQMARKALREKGGPAGAAAFPSGDKEPTN